VPATKRSSARPQRPDGCWSPSIGAWVTHPGAGGRGAARRRRRANRSRRCQVQGRAGQWPRDRAGGRSTCARRDRGSPAPGSARRQRGQVVAPDHLGRVDHPVRPRGLLPPRALRPGAENPAARGAHPHPGRRRRAGGSSRPRTPPRGGQTTRPCLPWADAWGSGLPARAPFPRNGTSSIACSLTVSSNREISARAAASSASRASARRPGFAEAKPASGDAPFSTGDAPVLVAARQPAGPAGRSHRSADVSCGAVVARRALLVLERGDGRGVRLRSAAGGPPTTARAAGA
jgi:hypothetical protein